MREPFPDAKSILECPVCLDEYDITKQDLMPVLLLCGHTFHLHCISKVSLIGNQIPCPYCKSQTPGPVKSLKWNFALIELLTSLAPQKKKTPCERCHSSEALLFCRNCPADLCETCDNEAHSLKILQNHIRAPIFTKNKVISSITCRLHDEPLKLFCNKCQISICQLCREFGEHRGHETLLQTAVEANRELRGLLEKSEGYSSRLEETVRELEEEDLKLQTKDFNKQLKDDISALVDALEQRRVTLSAAIQNDLTRKRAQLRSQIVDVQKKINQLQETRTQAQTALESYKEDCGIIDSLKEVTDSVGSIWTRALVHESVPILFPKEALLSHISKIGLVGGPPPPTLSLTAVSETAIAINWSPAPSEGELGKSSEPEYDILVAVSSNGLLGTPSTRYSGPATSLHLRDLEPSTLYAFSVRERSSRGSTDWSSPLSIKTIGPAPLSMNNKNRTSSTQKSTAHQHPKPSGKIEYKTAGTFEFVVPDGVMEISCLAIGGGGSGSCFTDVKGNSGLPSRVGDFLVAYGGESNGNKGGLGGAGNYKNGGRGGNGGYSARGYSHGGGGAAGGNDGQDALSPSNGFGGSTDLHYAGAGGNGRFNHQFSDKMSQSGPGSERTDKKGSYGMPGDLYGGGGGGCHSGGGGGGGYSVIWKHPVVPASKISVVVGDGGSPVLGSLKSHGGAGGRGFVLVVWGSEQLPVDSPCPPDYKSI
eukprot:TRINITY_DN17252_c0_g1_i1.p1 TRINITY_DN17252_c0_g1~~TRINITY_DN17252_c0_g1_i1.p1  ORF type:complete len:706 (+),score=133.96 TRINITY_DN17252_c0_g1_i1:83-2200(+)